MTTYTDPSSKLSLPCRRKPEPEIDQAQVGCSNVGCIFHPDRQGGTTGVCACPAGASNAERDIIRKALGGNHEKINGVECRGENCHKTCKVMNSGGKWSIKCGSCHNAVQACDTEIDAIALWYGINPNRLRWQDGKLMVSWG